MIKIKNPTRIVSLDIGNTPELEQERIAHGATYPQTRLVMHDDGMYRCPGGDINWWILRSDGHSTEHLPRLRMSILRCDRVEVAIGSEVIGIGKTAENAVTDAIRKYTVKHDKHIGGILAIPAYLFTAPDCGCGFEPVVSERWGYLTNQSWDECIHRIIARHCSSCSTDWTSATLEASGGDEGGLEHEDCPTCKTEVTP